MRSKALAALAVAALLCGAGAVALTVGSTSPGALVIAERAAPASPAAGRALVHAGVETPGRASNDSLTLELGPPLGTEVPNGLVSLSMESQLFNEGAVAASAPSLVALIRTLHPGRLRVGANTGDSQGLTAAGLARLAALTRATDTPVVLGLPLVRFDPTAAASLAAAAERALGPLLIAVEVGNESDAYGQSGHPRRGTDWTFDTYLGERNAYIAALLAAGVRKPVWGPDNSRTEWLGLTVAAGGAGFAVLTPHYYPLRGCGSRALSMVALLSGTLHQQEERAAASFLQASLRSGLPVVVGEANSGTCGGVNGVSDRAGAALWAADLALLMARAGTLSVQFHLGLAGCLGYNPICNPTTGPDFTDSWRAAPPFEGLVLPSLVTGGKFLALQTVSVPEQVHNFRFYAVTMPDGHLRLVGLDLDPAQTTPIEVHLSGASATTTAATLLGGFQVPAYTGTAWTTLTPEASPDLSLTPGQAKVWDFGPSAHSSAGD